METLLQKIKAIEIKKVIYPVITSVMLLIVALLVIWAANLLRNNFNQAFSLNEKVVQSGLLELNIEGWNNISKRLGI